MKKKNISNRRNLGIAHRAFLPALAAAAVALAPTVVWATSDAETAALQARLDALAKEVAELKQQRPEKEAATTAPSSAANVTLNTKGLNIVLPDKSASLKVGLLFQLDQRSWIGDKTERDQFRVRRARLPISGSFANGAVKFAFVPEFHGDDTDTTKALGNSNTKLYDAWVELRHSPVFGVRFGKFGCPVSIDGTDPRHFMEAGFTSYLAPNRDIGIDATGSFGSGVVSYRLGLYNGAPNNSQAETVNVDKHFTVGARLSFAPFKNSKNALSGLFFGIGGTYGSENSYKKGSDTATANRIRSGVQQTVLPDFASYGDHLRIAPGIGYFYGPFSMLAEFAVDHYEHVGTLTGESATNQAGYVSAGWVLTGEKATIKGVTPAAPFNLAKRNFGAVEISGRFGWLLVDRELRGSATAPTAVREAFACGIGVNWWLSENVLFRLGVERTEFYGIRHSTSAAFKSGHEFFVFSRLQLSF